jgi:hypothetical protein
VAEITRLRASEMAWKLIAKHNSRWNALPQTEKEAALAKALESTTEDFCKGEDEMERLRAQRDQLLVALKGLCEADRDDLNDSTSTVWNEAVAAIAAVESSP